jgi:hypothetical protein
MQKAVFPTMPYFVAPDDLSAMLRPTSRQERHYICVVSLGVIADNEKAFREFCELMRKGCHYLYSQDNDNTFMFTKRVNVEPLVASWKQYRKQGASKVGGRISADNRKAKSAAGASIIKDRWGQPSKDWPTKVLLKEADLSYNTAITVLGKRPIAQYNYQAAQKRKERRNAKA